MDKILLATFVVLCTLSVCSAIKCKACIGATSNRTSDGGCYDGASNALLKTSNTADCPTNTHAWLGANPGFSLDFCWKWQTGNTVYRGCGSTGTAPGCDGGEGCIDTNIWTVNGFVPGRACCCKTDECNSATTATKSLMLMFGLACLALVYLRR